MDKGETLSGTVCLVSLTVRVVPQVAEAAGIVSSGGLCNADVFQRELLTIIGILQLTRSAWPMVLPISTIALLLPQRCMS